MARRYDTVSLLTDLGLGDETVGVLHAVLRVLAPHARVIDLTHLVPVPDVRDLLPRLPAPPHRGR